MTRTVRICYFNPWGTELELAFGFLKKLPRLDVSARVANASDPQLIRKARLDCDWYGENVRCFEQLRHPQLRFLPAWITGGPGLGTLAQTPPEPGVERWFITMGQQPAVLDQKAGRVFQVLQTAGVNHLYYAFDEASRNMACFRAIAPFLRVLIHDESALGDAAHALPANCRRIHRSWVANLVPFGTTFFPHPEKKIVFLGSQMGLTESRRRQIQFLRKTFLDRVTIHSDHSLSVPERQALHRYQVSFCPEGRHFTTPAMSRAHTDRPFWSGCLGMVPVSENSQAGDRLTELAAARLIVRYDHGDLKSLASACERALEYTEAERRKIYEHFNAHETIGSVVAEAIAAAG